ncbi:Response regulator receiver domain-containing protein [Pseudomonas gessardii]|uniref:response regulator transcription factor n=1 Tax=Pseudomonas gessardii TaxID=78544 RepID=UPI00088D7E94|nr:response regulator [Pseudomonas gessardii]MRU52275.1 response regulator [Pseudomonas gessardii]ONH40119.1 response regulator [Pseudomonas gessardii]SDQ70413.1 Response regulator receiver domain-containing protein [Pseudomonas gessardii]
MPERQLRILLVEDHPFQLLAIQSLLKSFGFTQLTPAENAEQAIKLMRTTEVPFDVMLCDQCLPDLTGLELVEIASHAGFVKSAVLLSGLPALELEYLKTLAIKRDLRLLGYLAKPLNKEAWIELISQSGLTHD